MTFVKSAPKRLATTKGDKVGVEDGERATGGE